MINTKEEKKTGIEIDILKTQNWYHFALLYTVITLFSLKLIVG